MSYTHLHRNMHYIFSLCWLTAHYMHIYVLQSDCKDECLEVYSWEVGFAMHVCLAVATLPMFHLSRFFDAAPSR